MLFLAGFSYWLVFDSSTQNRPDLRKADFYQVSLRAEPLIQAIDGYTADKKHPPRTLADLVPLYLGEIPGTGLDECDWFKYMNFGTSRIALIWYDLGNRHGAPMAKASKFPDGEQDHSILTFTIGENDHVIDAKFDRMPKGFQLIEFDKGQWLAGNNRIAMAPDLPEKYQISRMPRAVLEELLGAPDGVRVLRDTPWELRVNCPRTLTQRDIFIYWPTQSYPEQAYGGDSELIGKWLYIH